MGRRKWIVRKLKQLDAAVKRIDGRTRMLAAGLRELLVLDEDYVSMVACKDEVDEAIVDVLRSAGEAGRLPRDIANDLKRYRLNPWNVSQRIRRMNKRLDQNIAKHVAEKRGLRWALTSWAFQNLGATREEMEDL